MVKGISDMERIQRAVRIVRTDGTAVRHGRLCIFTHDQRHEAAKLPETLHFRLERIAHKPISQRQVERLLDISANERLLDAPEIIASWRDADRHNL